MYLFFNWRIISLQNFFVFYQTSTWISHRYTYSRVCMSVPNSLNISPPILPCWQPNFVLQVFWVCFCLSLFLFHKQVHLYHFFIDLAYKGCHMIFFLLPLTYEVTQALFLSSFHLCKKWNRVKGQLSVGSETHLESTRFKPGLL